MKIPWSPLAIDRVSEIANYIAQDAALLLSKARRYRLTDFQSQSGT